MKSQLGQTGLGGLNILQTGTDTIPGRTSVTANQHYSLYTTIYHNLGYPPQYLIYATMPELDWYGDQKEDITIPLPQGVQESSTLGGNGNFYFLGAIADDTILTIYNNAYTHSSPTPIPDIPIRYYIFNGTTQ